MTDARNAEPLVAVVIPALNEAGKIGRVLDKLPRDGRFEAIVVDDGSTDGTGDEARAHGALGLTRNQSQTLGEYKSQAKALFKKLSDASPTQCTLETGPYYFQDGVFWTACAPQLLLMGGHSPAT